MKVCPVCGSRFEETETFCPHDGARLDVALDHAPGQLVGETLGGEYTLDELVFSDLVGERYVGTTSKGARVRVTVFSELAAPEPERASALESTRALVGEDPPPGVGRLLDYDLEAEPAWVVEQYAEGEPFTMGVGPMRWEHALATINHAARALEWLHRVGVTHRALHPRALTRSADGEVTVFEWAHGVLLNQTNPMELAALGGFVAYPSYIAPELTRPSKKPTQKTAVFALGAMAYEAITGRALAADDDAETVLKRHRRERLLGLSLAAPEADLPQGFDDVFGLVIDRSPKRRFQALGAMVNALAGILGEDPDDSFPQLAVEDPDPRVDDASTDTEQMDMSVLDEDKRKPGSPGPKKKRRRRASKEAPAAKVVVDDALTEGSDSGAVSGSSETSDSDGPPPERPRRRRRPRPDGEDPEGRPRRRKRRRPRPDGEEGEEGEGSPRRRKRRRKRRPEGDDASEGAESRGDDATPDDERSSRRRKRRRRRPRPEGEAPDANGDGGDDDSSEESADSPSPERKRKRRRKRRRSDAPGEDSPRRRKRRAPPVDPTPQRDDAKTKEPVAKRAKHQDTATPNARPAPKLAPKTASSSGEAAFDDSWFSNDSTEKAWDETYLREHKSTQDKRYNTMLVIGLVALGIAAIALIVYSVTYEDPPEEESSLGVEPPAYALTLPSHPGPLHDFQEPHRTPRRRPGR